MDNQVKINSGSFRQQSFEVILIFYLVLSILSNSFFALYLPRFNTIAAICFALLFLREIIINKFSYKTLFSVLVVVCFVALVLMSNNLQMTNPLIALMVFSLCARNLDYKHILKLSYRIVLAMLLLIMMSSQLGIITDYVTNQNGRTRHFLGFLYALYPATLVLELMLISVYLRKGVKSTIFLILLNVVVFYYTDSRLSFGLTLLSIVLCSEFVSKIVKKLCKFRMFKMILSSVYIFFAASSLWISVIYTDSVGWLNELNQVLSYRLGLGKKAIAVYGITWLGKPVSFNGASVNANGINVTAGMEYFTVDNGYLDILIKYGIIAEVIYLALLTYILYILLKTENYGLYQVFLIIGLHLTIDFSMLSLVYNPFVLIIFYKRDSLMQLSLQSKEKLGHRFRLVLHKK